MIANDPYAELERRFARLSAVNRASAILNWDRSTMMPDGRQRGPRRPARDPGRDRPRHDRGARHARAAVAGGGGRARPRSRGAPPTCARCAAPGSTRARCRPTSSRRARAPPRPARWSWREARKNADFKSLLPTLGEVLAITRRVGEAKAAALGTLALRRAARRVRAGRPLGAHRRAVRRAARLPARPAAAASWSARQRPASRCALDGPFPVDAAAQARRGADAAASASTSRTAGSTSRRIPSPAARPTTCASPRATTRTTSRAP